MDTQENYLTQINEDLNTTEDVLMYLGTSIGVSDDLIVAEDFNYAFSILELDSCSNITIADVATVRCSIAMVIQFGNTIQIEVQVDLHKNELLFLEGLIVDKTEARRQQIARYFFMMKYTIKQISESLGISPQLVRYNIDETKSELLKNIRKDLRANKKLLAHMVGIIYNLEQQHALMMNKYSQMETDLAQARTFLTESVKKGLTNIQKIEKCQKMVNELYSLQKSYLDATRAILKQMVDTWQVFGLTGEDAIKLVVSGGLDVDIKFEQIKTIMVKVAGIVKAEVKDSESRYRIFNQIAREVNFDGLVANPQ